MATENPAGTRPRPWILIALAAAVALFVIVKLWPGAAAPSPPPASAPPQARGTSGAVDGGSVDPEDLEVELGALKNGRPELGEIERNPFGFQPKAPAVVPPESGASASGLTALNGTGAATAAVPVGPPPIPLKFIGIVEGPDVGKVAAFSDCTRTFQGREGEIVDGRYKLLKIGVESVVMSYPDGRGQQTIRLTGQECVER